MEITVTEKDNFAVVHVSGRIVRDNQMELRAKLEEAIAAGARGISLDFREVQYLDSSGMGCCVSVLKSMHDRNGGSMVVFGASPAIEKAWKLIRLDMVIPLFPDEETALAQLRADAPD